MDYSIIIGTLAGALIAGIIGLLTTRYDRKLIRREKHLADLQAQFDIISREVNDPFHDMWPPWSDDTMQCPIPYPGIEPNTYPLETYHIPSRQIFEERENKRYVNYANETLYLDLENHFPKLWSLLQEWEEKVKKEGPILLKSYYSVCGVLYGDSIELTRLRMKEDGTNPVDATNGAPYDGAALNILLGADEAAWPNLKRSCGKYFPQVQIIAEKYKNRVEIETIKRLLEEFSALNEKCNQEIEAVGVEKKLKGNCNYA
jgi:hypothetical protein